MAQVPDRPDVLVTGSAGHLGCALLLALPSYGFTPLGVDVLPSETTHLLCDIADPAAVARVFASHPTIKHVVHAATLHKPHVGSHSKQDFVRVNISGTLHLLEAAAAVNSKASTRATAAEAGAEAEAGALPRIRSFVFLSTTSAFGSALSPKPGSPAAWIDESVVPRPKNVYGATKTAAEDLCYLVHREHGLPVLVLRTSRFFPEEDDDEDRRTAMADENLKVCELTYRRVDVADVVQACVCAMRKAGEIGWGRYIVSAPSPFANDAATLAMLDSDAAAVMRAAAPGCEEVFAGKGWEFLRRIDRVYDSSKALRELGWRPEHTFENAVAKVARGEEWRSELTFKVGKKGYHAVPTGVYTVR